MSSPRRRCGSYTSRALLLVLAVAVVTVVGAPPVVAGAAPTERATSLVERFFDTLVEEDGSALKRFLSPAFQLQGADGGFLTKADFLASPPVIESYELDNVKATRAGSVIVVRYDVTAVVTIDGVPQSREPAPRLSVFTKGKNGWQMIAHANFNTSEDDPQQ